MGRYGGTRLKIKVGPHEIAVISDQATTLDLLREGKYGDSDPGALTIRVRSDLPPSVWRETVMHEALHHVVALTHLAVRWADGEEEEIIRALSPYLVDLKIPARPSRA